MTQQTEPTEDDIRTLARALDLEERFSSGIFPRGGAQTSQYRKLCRRERAMHLLRGYW